MFKGSIPALVTPMRDDGSIDFGAWDGLLDFHLREGTDGVYVSLDIDVVDPVYCPAQKYPEPAGLTSKQVITALRRIGQVAEVRGFDLCCLGPQYDDRVGTGSHLAARFFVEVMAAMAWRRSRP